MRKQKSIIMKYFLIFSCLLFSVPLISDAQHFTYEKSDEGILVKEDDENVLFYQAKTKSKDGKYSRADYVHPLYGLDGFVLTEDFPKDHLHHRGIFWAWHQVIIGDLQIGDAWECKDFEWDVVEFDVEDDGDAFAGLETKTYWQSPLWLDGEGKMKPFVEEKANIRIYPKTKNYRIIDFEIALLALEPDLKIAGSNDEKGYGGFSVRMLMPEDITFISENGPVNPTTNQLSAGPWINVSGTLTSGGGKAGIVMICNSANPVYPDPWILRASGSMQNPAYPGRQPVGIAQSEPTVLKYRLIIYKGEISKDQIDDLSKSFK
jgi:hypothetical protein